MIKADKTAIRVEGSNLELATQFLHIMDTMIEIHPEMVAAYIHVRNAEIEEAIKTADTVEIKMSESIYKALSVIERMVDDGKS